jgi:murein DD-endopeptidase MepM/ murein hydrolase activator NlpD
MRGHSESSILKLLGRALLGATLIISANVSSANCTDTVHDDDHLYSLPYASNKSYRVLQGFGSRFSHTGLEEFAIDIDMPVGTPVHAARDGVVAEVEESHNKGCWDDGCGNYANFIVILHSDGTTGEYYHLKKGGSAVAVGDTVTQGQKIGYSGNTGHTTMPHLHFAVYCADVRGNIQSIPVRFRSSDGIIERPRRGARYQAL